jgi:hypothetical protein
MAGRNVLCRFASAFIRVFLFINQSKGNQMENAIVEKSVVEFAPAVVVVSGLTATEKKLSVVTQASSAALAYLSNSKGTVGKVARETLSQHGEALIAKQCRNGNYRPLADAIAAITGASLSITSRGSYESLVDRFTDQLKDLKGAGFIECKKTGAMKPNAKRNMLVQVINLVTEVQSIAATL